MTDPVTLADWNDVLRDWFFPTGSKGQRVYFRSDDAELTRLAESRSFDIAEPGDNLISAVRSDVRGNTGYLSHRGVSWQRAASPDVSPPWLAVLAVSVLVAERETDHGSLRFYEPFSEALGYLPGRRMSQEEYEETCFRWWVDLARWLTDTCHGERGQPTWRLIPASGPRCVIGHPYTQILLRQEDRRDIDAFLASMAEVEPGELTVVANGEAARTLVEEFRRWAQGRRLSAHLVRVLEGGDAPVRDSLAYVLLDRLLDSVEPIRARPSDRRCNVLVMVDDWSTRRLQFAMTYPESSLNWEDRVVHLDGAPIGPAEPGAPVPLPMEVTASRLEEPWNIVSDEGVVLEFSAQDVVCLAVRSWDAWCSVVSAEPGEEVYLLGRSARLSRGDLYMTRPQPATSISGVPPGWTLLGPSELADLPDDDSVPAALRRRWTAVPRLAGGFEVGRHAYLHGGPPGLIVPASLAGKLCTLDGEPLIEATIESRIHPPPELDEGPHSLELGPYRLAFDVLRPRALPQVTSSAQRTVLGRLRAVRQESAEPAFSGAYWFPWPPDESVVWTLPGKAVVFGRVGQIARIVPTMSPWALAAGLTLHVFEPVRRSSYSGGARPFSAVTWVGVWSMEGWTLTRISSHPEEPSTLDGPVDPLWVQLVTDIGPTPQFAMPRRPHVSLTDERVVADWQQYAATALALEEPP